MAKSRKLLPNDRIRLCRNNSNMPWRIVEDTVMDSFWHALNNILLNEFNDYAEYKNCGVLHRMIRYKDLKLYGLSDEHQ